jgi:flagellar FliL protein
MATSPQVAIPVPAAPAAPRSSKLLIGLLIAVGVIAAGAVAFILVGPKLMGGAPSAEAAPKHAAPEKPIYVTLEPLTVNLQSEGRGRFLHIGISLKVDSEEAKGQITELMPDLRGRVLLLLSNRAPDSLVSTEDKTKLADEILKALNTPVSAESKAKDMGITSVSFNTFVVQ